MDEEEKIYHWAGRPRTCPHCGGEIADIIWGMPNYEALQKYEAETGHKYVLGGCCLMEGENPEYECLECHNLYVPISFPRNCKQLAHDALIRKNSKKFKGVKYLDFINDRKLYATTMTPGYSRREAKYAMVDQYGHVEVYTRKEIVKQLVVETVKKHADQDVLEESGFNEWADSDLDFDELLKKHILLS